VADDGRLIAGRYRLLTRIGSGAMGVVWTARDERLHRTVAVKQLLLSNTVSAAESHEAKQRAMREGRIAARLQHPHAIAVYDVAEEDGNPWLIMEYLPSRSLSAVLGERGTLPPREVARIASQAASALDAAHAAGIVHRDIKPGNILLGDDGVVKITDFGISRATGDVTVTATGMLAGTPAYLAPEVAKGHDPGPPSDVFSLGSTIYASVEGEPPFGLNENTLALLHAVAAGQVNPARHAGPLQPLLMRMLAPEPSGRPTMSQCRQALAAIASGQPIPPALLGAAPTPVPPTRRVGPPAPVGRAVSPSAATPAASPQTRLDVRPFDHEGDTRLRSDVAMRPSVARLSGLSPAESARPQKSSKKSMVVAGLAIVAAAAVGILLANALTSPPNAQNGAQTTGPTQPANPPVASSAPSTTTATRTASSTTSSTTTSTSASTTSTTASQADLVNAITGYYGLLPDNTDEAFQRLSPAGQTRAGGAATYRQFWAGIAQVSTSQVRATGRNQVTAVVSYVRKDGTTARESDTFTLVQSGNLLLIDSWQQQQLGGQGQE